MAATAALGLALAVSPGNAALAIAVYLPVLGALGLPAVIARTVGRHPQERPTRLDRPPPARRPHPRPGELLELERAVALATETAFDAHYRLRPTVRRIAAARLGVRAVDLDTGSAAVRALLGPEAWELARPDRSKPRDHDDPGLSTAGIDTVIAALEKL